MQCRKCQKSFVPTAHQIKKHDWICAPCLKLSFKEWRIKRKEAGNPVISTKMPPEYHARYAEEYKKREDVKARKRSQQKRYRNDPHLRMKHEARWQANKALNSGKLMKKPCETCGAKTSEMHHPDYYKPLEIIWLCRKCHDAVHAKAKGQQ